MRRIFRSNTKNSQCQSLELVMRSPNIKPAFRNKLSISEADTLMDLVCNCKFEIVGGRLDVTLKLKNCKRQFKVSNVKKCC